MFKLFGGVADALLLCSCQICRLPPAQASQKEMHANGLNQDFPEASNSTKQNSLGGWLRCTECTAALHFKCLNKQRQSAILTDVRAELAEEAPKGSKPPLLTELPPSMVREDIPCMSCYEEPALCFICGLDPVGRTSQEADEMWGNESDDDISELGDYARPVFRCRRCTRFAHYECLANTFRWVGNEHAAAYRIQLLEHWNCPDCIRWPKVQRIHAWRRMSTAEAQKIRNMNYGQKEDRITDLTREYLVKLADMSWRDAAWVPHSWLERVNSTLLKRFRSEASVFLPEKIWYAPVINEWTPSHYNAVQKADEWEELEHDPEQPWVTYTHGKPSGKLSLGQHGEATPAKGRPEADPTASQRIPTSWLEPERILDVFYRPSVLPSANEASVGVKLTEMRSDSLRIRPMGLPPTPVDGLIHISELDGTNFLNPKEAQSTLTHVAWLLVKWVGLGYNESSWTTVTPSTFEDISYSRLLLRAYFGHLNARDVLIRVPEQQMSKPLEDLSGISSFFKAFSGGRELADYQVSAVQQMLQLYDKKSPCILADDSGMGKTAQIIAFIAWLFYRREAAPFLLLVPPHTNARWTRLLRAWLPSANTVACSGLIDARKVLEEYELFHGVSSSVRSVPGLSPLKAEIIVADANDKVFLKTVASLSTPWALVVAHVSSFYFGDIEEEMMRLNSQRRMVYSDMPLPDHAWILSKIMDFVNIRKGALSALVGSEPEASVASVVERALSSVWIRRRRTEMLKSVSPCKVTELTVYTGLKAPQKAVYKSILRAHIETIKSLCSSTAKTHPGDTSRALSGIVFEILRACQSAFLCGGKGANLEHAPNPSLDHLLESSAKLQLLRPILRSLQGRGHRTVIVASMSMTLDMIEELIVQDQNEYIRADRESGPHDIEMVRRAWNQKDSTYPFALLHSRVCSADLNFLAADTVIVRFSNCPFLTWFDIAKQWLSLTNMLMQFFGQDMVPSTNWINMSYVWRFGQTKVCAPHPPFHLIGFI